MTGKVQTGRCADNLIRHRSDIQLHSDNDRSSGGFDLTKCKAENYRPSSVIATGSFGAVSPPLSG